MRGENDKREDESERDDEKMKKHVVLVHPPFTHSHSPPESNNTFFFL